MPYFRREALPACGAGGLIGSLAADVFWTLSLTPSGLPFDADPGGRGGPDLALLLHVGHEPVRRLAKPFVDPLGILEQVYAGVRHVVAVQDRLLAVKQGPTECHHSERL